MLTCPVRYIWTGLISSFRVLLNWHNPNINKAAGKDIDKGDQVVEETRFVVTGSLEEPLQNADKDEVDHQDNRNDGEEIPLVQIQHYKAQNASKNLRKLLNLLRIIKENLTKQRKINKESGLKVDSPPLESPIAGGNTQHHRVNGHQHFSFRGSIS